MTAARTRRRAPRQGSMDALLDGAGGDPGTELARRHGATHVIGVDEVGRGPLAGPVVTCAVVARAGQALPDGVDDSKALTPAQRRALLQPIREAAVAHALGEATVEEIDAVNILQASLLAMRRAVLDAWRGAGHPACVVLVDGRERIPDLELPQHAVIGGDARCKVIAAASILAKEHRDAFMEQLGAKHPGYGFEKHKGYASAQHVAALRDQGPTPHHRRSFEPVRTFVATGRWPGAGDA